MALPFAGLANTLTAERAVLGVKISQKHQEKQVAAQNVVATTRKIEILLRNLGPQSNSVDAKERASVDFWTRTSLTETSHRPYDHKEQVHLPTEFTGMC